MEEQPDSDQTGSYAKRGRFWAVTDGAGRLVCLAVYRKGAREVLRRLASIPVAGTDRPKERTDERHDDKNEIERETRLRGD